MSIDHPA